MMFPKKILFLIAFCITSIISIAQQKNITSTTKYRAVHWGIDEGLGKPRWHNAIIKDANGFMWFGSNHGELSRFDGSSFKHYYPDKNKAGHLRSDHCVAMIEDSLHNLWIGTFSGLSRYDIKADTFTNFPIHINPITSDKSVVPFWASSNEVFCLETGNQVTSYDTHSFKRKKLIDIKESDKVGISNLKASHAVFDAQSNSIWMLPESEEGLVQFSISTGKILFHKQISYSNKPDAWKHIDAEAMCFDRKRNCIWINSHDGLTQFTLSNQQFHHVDELNPFIHVKGYARMVGIDIDTDGRIWLATIPKGILIYNPSTQNVTTLFPDSAMQHETGDGNLKIYCDRDGIIWTSYFALKEIYQLIPYSPLVQSFVANHFKPDSLISLDIGNMVEGEHGELWIGTSSGLNIYNPIKETFRLLTEKDFPGIKGNIIFPMAIDTLRKKAWICASSPDKVYEMNLQTKKCKPLLFKDTLGRTVPPVYIVGLASTPYKNGCVFCDFGYGIFEVQDDSAVARLIIPFRREIYKSILVEDSMLFLKTFPARITYYKYGSRWLKKNNFLDNIDWDDFFYDTLNKTYWVAVAGKIIHYNKSFHIIRSYTNSEELMRGIINILPDKNGNVWFNNDRKMIGNLNIKTGIVTMLSEQDGYQKQWYDVYTALPAKAAGNLYFVGNPLAPEISFEQINPDKLNTYPPAKVYFRSLEIKDFSSSLSSGVDNIKKLSLKYFQNRINIETGVIDYYSKGKNYIRYKLEVNRKAASWQYVPLKSVIHYEELPPGNYKLIIQASNAANEFNGPEKILLVNISTAFWNTWWFRLIIIAIAAFIIVNIFQQRIKKIRHDAYIKNQLKDLEMKALKAQMNPHFIYNALNSIQALVANNKNAEGIHYIGSFSRLLRQVLNNSENNVISLDKELETIDLYIQLESLRLNMQLQYKKIVPENIVTEFEKIPPLILQPFVENALWHGLSNKQGEKEIEISISIQDSWLLCNITDNGIGRTKAQQLKNNAATLHQSKGIDITYKRLLDFNEDNSVVPIEFVDLYNNKRNACGTRVMVRIKRKSGSSSLPFNK